MPDTNTTASAWLLHAADNIQFCIGLHQAAEYIEAPSLHAVPLATDYCKNIIFWRDLIVPVIDMNILVGNHTMQNNQFVMVIAYQTKDNTPLEYMAFKLASAPRKILVNDNDVCQLPDTYPKQLKPFVLSLFKHNNKIASIFDIAQLSLGTQQSA